MECHQEQSCKVALITGAALRIGRVIAERFHAAGYQIAIHYNTSCKAATRLADELNQQRLSSAITLQADLSEPISFEENLEKVVNTWGRLDVLVNNASCFFPTPVSDVTQTQWAKLLNCNLQGPFFLSQACFFLLKQVKGSIINITDIHGRNPLKGYGVYSISKAGLEMMTKSLAKEFAPHVRVNAIAPGAIMWPLEENALTASQKQAIIDKSLLKCHGSADDIADAALYFANASFVTAQSLALDGGRGIG